MIDKTKNEALALEFASLYAGQFIEAHAHEIGTDLTKWPKDAWMQLIECAVTGFVERMQELGRVPESQ